MQWEHQANNGHIMGRRSNERAMGSGCSLALAMFSCYAMLWDDMLRYAILASVVMNRLLSRGPLGIGSVRVCVCVCVRVCVWCVWEWCVLSV